MKSLRHVFPFKSYFHFRFPLPVSWPTYEFRLPTPSACKTDVGVPMWMIQCHVHVQIHDVPVQNSGIPSLWNCTHFRPTPGLVEFHFRSRGMRYRRRFSCVSCGIGPSRNRFLPHVKILNGSGAIENKTHSTSCD